MAPGLVESRLELGLTVFNQIFSGLPYSFCICCRILVMKSKSAFGDHKIVGTKVSRLSSKRLTRLVLL